jgi:hypothetical protein
MWQVETDIPTLDAKRLDRPVVFGLLVDQGERPADVWIDERPKPPFAPSAARREVAFGSTTSGGSVSSGGTATLIRSISSTTTEEERWLRRS